MPRAFSCRCKRPVFFRNSRCLGCAAELGFAPARRELLAIEPAREPGWWREAGAARARRYRRCANLDSACACNWLVEERQAADGALCRSCRLTRTLPDLSLPGNAQRWLRIEQAKRQLVSALIALGLGPKAKAEDADNGLAFDLLQTLPGAPPVVTGHAHGVITLDVEEADDATREQRRQALGEPYRTLLGHLRHEVGHYLLAAARRRRRLARTLSRMFRRRARRLRRCAAGLPRAGCACRLGDCATSARMPQPTRGRTGPRPARTTCTWSTRSTPRAASASKATGWNWATSVSTRRHWAAHDTTGTMFVTMLNAWIELTGVLNELSRSMGLADFYPFVLSAPAARKLLFVHRVFAAVPGTPLAPHGATPSPSPAEATS